MTATKTSSQPTTTPDGRPGFRIECTCKSHPEGASSAVTAFPVAAAKIHGNVLMANHPATAIRKMNERRGIWAA
jgi:hypothetical protein